MANYLVTKRIHITTGEYYPGQVIQLDEREAEAGILMSRNMIVPVGPDYASADPATPEAVAEAAADGQTEAEAAAVEAANQAAAAQAAADSAAREPSDEEKASDDFKELLKLKREELDSFAAGEGLDPAIFENKAQVAAAIVRKLASAPAEPEPDSTVSPDAG